MKRHISTSSEKYKNMSIEQKIKVIEAKLLYANHARKVPYRYLTVNRLNQILEELYEEKSKQLCNINNDYVENINNNNNNNDNNIVAGQNNNQIPDDIDVRSEDYKKLSDKEKLNVVRSKLTKLFNNTSGKFVIVMYNGQKEKINRDKQGEYKDLVEREKKLKDIINQKHIDFKRSNKDGIKKIPFYDNCIVPFINKITDNFGKLGKYKSNKIFKTKRVKKTKNGKIKRRITAGCCALIIFFTGFMLSRCNKDSSSSVNSIVGSSSQNNDNVNNNIEDENKENNNNNNNTDNEDKENNNNNNNTDNEDKENNNNCVPGKDDEFKLTFDDTVTINKNSYIYTNSYDATYDTNSINPYYAGHYERDVQGLVYNLDGKIYVIYETDADALKKQRELEKSGAIMTAVLVTRNDLTHIGQYEGYYSIDSVRVKSR